METKGHNQKITPQISRANGSVVQASFVEGAVCLHVWPAGEDPESSDPWVIARVLSDGSVETFGDLPVPAIHQGDQVSG